MRSKIKYTTDGTQPNSSSTALSYTSPIIVAKATSASTYVTIKAYAAFEGMMDSNVTSTTYALPTITYAYAKFFFSGNYGTGNIIDKGIPQTFYIT